MLNVHDKRLKILVVKDDDNQLSKIKSILTDSQHPSFLIHGVSSLTHALEALHAWPFDAVLLDLFLPDCQGIKTLKQIRKAAPSLGIIVLAQSADPSLSSQAAREGALGFLFSVDLNPKRLIRIITLVLERNQRKQTLTCGERRYREIIENLNDAYYEMDLRGIFTYNNKASLKHIGRPHHEVIGSHGTISDPTPEQSERNIKAYREVYKTGRTGTILDTTLVRPDGSQIIVELRVSLLRDEQGNPIGFSGISRDVTEKIAVQKALKASEEKYRGILESMEDGYFEYDLKGRLLFYNEGLSTIFGYTVEELGDRDYRSYMDEANAEKVFRAYRHIYRTGEPNRSLQNEVITKQGLRRYVENSVSLMKDDQGRPIGFHGIVRDITEQKAFELDLARAREKADAATLAKSEFLANMSHEIRTPMNGIIGMYNLLLSTSLTAEQDDFVRTGKESAEALLITINDILDFSKIEAGKLEIETIEFDLRSTLDNLVSNPARTAEKKGLELIYFIDHLVPSLLMGDPGRLRQILMNLISNAIKFTHKGEVVLRVDLKHETQHKATLLFSVQDTGLGISSANQEHLFQSFQQVDNSSTRKYGGTGLGLAIAGRLTELLGGEMGLESQLNKGSTFWLKLDFDKVGVVPTKSWAAPETLRHKRILIVDDNLTNLDVLEGYLKRWGCNCDRATTGPLALSIMKAVAKSGTPYDVVISDMMMPEMDGEELGRRIKTDPALAGSNLIMLTSQGMRGDVAEIKRIGFTAYLNKPVSPSQLYQCLLSLFGENANPQNKTKAKVITSYSLSEEKRRGINILLAEDNIINQKIALNFLKRFGFVAEVAANGQEAVDKLASEDYDLVFMDIQMPGMNGFEATGTIRDPNSNVRNHCIPIIAMTATDTPEDRRRCLSAGMDDYIAKPIQPDNFLKMIEKWIAKKDHKEIEG